MLSILRQRSRKHYLQKTLNLRNLLGQKPERIHYYFGYGANLSMDRFHKRGMNVEEVGNACLQDFEIRFTLKNEYQDKGYAGVHEKQGEQVWGVVYKMDELALKLMDSLEWCGYGAYERKKVTVKTDTEEIEAWCYFVKYPDENLVPSNMYLGNMIKASEERVFPESYISYLKSHNSREKFEINYNFSLLFYGQKRLFFNQLKPLYIIHDKLREKLCDLI